MSGLNFERFQRYHHSFFKLFQPTVIHSNCNCNQVLSNNGEFDFQSIPHQFYSTIEKSCQRERAHTHRATLFSSTRLGALVNRLFRAIFSLLMASRPPKRNGYFVALSSETNKGKKGVWPCFAFPCGQISEKLARSQRQLDRQLLTRRD